MIMQLSPYLHFNDACETAFKFYEKCLGGKIEALMPYAGSPAESHVPEHWKNKVMHARLVAEGAVLMGCDAPPDRQHKTQGISVTLTDRKSTRLNSSHA